ncbi:hypothetical protein BVV10_06360 [Xanthomonas oryzae pv. oryzae]|nr:hypothetical protein BVV16_06340 [Xanthomonas oryzae pv. oryzae]AUI93589.1 hypothetical protein BVV17_06350 [Xanthomonas oryzae pv. oryzae]AUI97262.1 hypothetical protein BVV18_06360 [Xanthomonas oryzae pv. oryzae]AUJ00934.1 hypothetical protein BVV10_06360 [Xanthomonas oryzae pv. oryzae]AUJ04610.1 hypothetical protein BVV19_06370 [Xanthomonas oryzae pv. oryzae]
MEKAHWLSRFSATISWSMTSILIQTNMKRLCSWFHILDSIQGAHHLERLTKPLNSVEPAASSPA